MATRREALFFRHLKHAKDMGPESECQTVVHVLIADDHALVRESVRHLIESYPDLRVIGEARNGADAVKLARQLRPQIVLMDFNMPIMDGTEAARTIAQEILGVKIVGMSVHPEAERLMRQAGAYAHVEKSELLTRLYPTVRMAVAAE
jgi:DNA-binding NarL/FixJ family response regulator